VGDILCLEYGYDSTHVSFYEVVGASSAMITIQEIGKKNAGRASGGMNLVMPVEGMYVGRPMKAKPRPDGSMGYSVKVTDGGYARLWNGRPQIEDAAGMR
jgi:hypothetical protein